MNQVKKNQMNSKRANELNGKSWTKHSVSIWSDIRKNREELGLKHPAIFPVALPIRLLECFATEEDKIVLDPFVGAGSTMVAAKQTGKKGIGIEISPEYTKVATNRLAQREFWPSSQEDGVVYNANALNLANLVGPESVDIVITSPPYWNVLTRKHSANQKAIEDYGDAVGDLGKIADYEEFLGALQRIFRLVHVALKKGKYCIVVVMDLRRGSKLYSLHLDVIQMMRAIGFTYADLIVWDRRYEYNNLRPLGYPYVFYINRTHEFILVFQKPGTESESR